jgi:hypothetical protein
MKFRRQTGFALVGTALATVLSWLLWSAREPRHQGKSLGEWLEIHHSPLSGLFLGEWTAEDVGRSVAQSSNAIVHIGSAAVPWAMRWSRQSSGSAKRWSRDFLEWFLPEGLKPPEPMEPEAKALACVLLLPDQFQEQNPELARRVRQGDDFARAMLEYQGTNALGAMQELLDDPDPKTRQTALDLISFCGSDAASAEPSLRSRLTVETDLHLRDEILLALAAIGRIDDGMVHDCGRALLEDSPDEWRAKTLAAILWSKPGLGMPYLLRGTTHDHPTTRWVSVAVLGSTDKTRPLLGRGSVVGFRAMLGPRMPLLKHHWQVVTAVTATNLLVRPEAAARLAGLRLATNQLFDPTFATNRTLVPTDVLLGRVAVLTNDPAPEVAEAAQQILAAFPSPTDRNR